MELRHVVIFALGFVFGILIRKYGKWVWSYYSYHFSGADYRTWQCDKMKRINSHGSVACQRMKHHPGECKWPGNH